MRNWLTWRRALGALALLFLLVLVLFGWQAYQAATGLFDARERANGVEQALTHGDFDGASIQLDELRKDTGRAAEATDGFLWDLGSHLPWLGDTIGAVQTTSGALHRVTSDNAPIGLRLSKAVTEGSLRPRDGRIDLAALVPLTRDVRRAADSIREQQQRLEELDVDGLLFPFDQVVRELAGQVDRAHGAAHATDLAFRLLPKMLGGDKPRTYLLVIQNNAEIRATGGLPGSIAVLHADRGHVTMGFQGSARDVNHDLSPVRGMSQDARKLYGPLLSADFRDVTFTPHFPEVARTAAAQFRQERGVQVDGVVSVDPVSLALMLQGTGPVKYEFQGRPTQLTFTTVVGTLLNWAYQVFSDQASQDEFFEESARAIFDSVLGGQGNERVTITGMATGVAQHRIRLWSRHADEQELIEATTIGGALPVDEEQPHIGLYFNDATGGKPEYYFDYQATASSRECDSEKGIQEIETTIAMTSTMPADPRKLSVWITGDGRFTPRGTIALNLRVYGPAGGKVVALSKDGEDVSITSDEHFGRQVAIVPVLLQPGERHVVKARIVSAPGQTGKPVLSLTPGVKLLDNAVETTSACAS